MATNPTTTTASAPRLRRTLTLWDLILYGVIVIQPVAPMSVFGVLSDRGHGHVVTTILIAMVAMLFTAISYGRMARAYPSAGSAFTYVGQEINPALGYVTGWSMVMDYMLNPMICIIWCSQQAHVFAPGVPYWVWAIFFALVFTFLNIQGIKTSARVNTLLAAGMGVVIAIFFVAAARYIFGTSARRRWRSSPVPFTIRRPGIRKAVLGGTSIAVLTYIGFDGISTLSEEAENPRRNILLATVLTCVVIGVLSALEVYAAQLVWPASQPFPNVDTAFTFVAGRAWAPLFADRGIHAAGGELRLRHGRANRRGPVALRHGTQQRAAEIVLRRRRSQAPRSAQQRDLRGRDRAGRRVAGERRPVQLRPGRGDAELRRADRLHGRERGGVHALLRARTGEEADQPDSAGRWDS